MEYSNHSDAAGNEYIRYRLRFVPAKGMWVSHGDGSVGSLKAKAQDMSPRSGDGEGVVIPLEWRECNGESAAAVHTASGAVEGFWYIYPVTIESLHGLLFSDDE